MSIWVPPSVHAVLEQDRAEILGSVLEVELTLASFNTELRQIDPHVRMIRAKDTLEPGSVLKAGYYHIIRDVPGAPVNVTPLEWPNGEYREPGSWVYEWLQEQDTWNDRATKAAKKRNKELQATHQRKKDREALARAAEFDDRVKHAENVQIRVPRSILDR